MISSLETFGYSAPVFLVTFRDSAQLKKFYGNLLSERTSLIPHHQASALSWPTGWDFYFRIVHALRNGLLSLT